MPSINKCFTPRVKPRLLSRFVIGLTNTGKAFDQSGIHDPVVEVGTDDITGVDTVLGTVLRHRSLYRFSLQLYRQLCMYPLASNEFKR